MVWIVIVATERGNSIDAWYYSIKYAYPNNEVSDHERNYDKKTTNLIQIGRHDNPMFPYLKMNV